MCKVRRGAAQALAAGHGTRRAAAGTTGVHPAAPADTNPCTHAPRHSTRQYTLAQAAATAALACRLCGLKEVEVPARQQHPLHSQAWQAGRAVGPQAVHTAGRHAARDSCRGPFRSKAGPLLPLLAPLLPLLHDPSCTHAPASTLGAPQRAPPPPPAWPAPAPTAQLQSAPPGLRRSRRGGRRRGGWGSAAAGQPGARRRLERRPGGACRRRGRQQSATLQSYLDAYLSPMPSQQRHGCTQTTCEEDKPREALGGCPG